MNEGRKRWKIKTDYSIYFLIVIELHDFHFIPAATMRGFDMHAAFCTFFCFSCKKLSGGQPVHAIVKIDDHACTQGEIAQ